MIVLYKEELVIRCENMCLIFSNLKFLGYYLEVLLMLGVFCKNPLNVTLRGVTSNTLDPSIDHLKATGLSTLRKFMLDDEGLDIKIVNRGR